MNVQTSIGMPDLLRDLDHRRDVLPQRARRAVGAGSRACASRDLLRQPRARPRPRAGRRPAARCRRCRCPSRSIRWRIRDLLVDRRASAPRATGGRRAASRRRTGSGTAGVSQRSPASFQSWISSRSFIRVPGSEGVQVRRAGPVNRREPARRQARTRRNDADSVRRHGTWMGRRGSAHAWPRADLQTSRTARIRTHGPCIQTSDSSMTRSLLLACVLASRRRSAAAAQNASTAGALELYPTFQAVGARLDLHRRCQRQRHRTPRVAAARARRPGRPACR